MLRNGNITQKYSIKALPVFFHTHTVLFVSSQGSVAAFPQACVEFEGHMD